MKATPQSMAAHKTVMTTRILGGSADGIPHWPFISAKGVAFAVFALLFFSVANAGVEVLAAAPEPTPKFAPRLYDDGAGERQTAASPTRERDGKATTEADAALTVSVGAANSALYRGRLRGVAEDEPAFLRGEKDATRRFATTAAELTVPATKHNTGRNSNGGGPYIRVLNTTIGGRSAVVLAAFKEDYAWAKKATSEVGLELHVYQSGDRNASNFVKNFASEGPKYLQFIIDNYDDLPDHTLFLHAHNNGRYSPSRKDKPGGGHRLLEGADQIRLPGWRQPGVDYFWVPEVVLMHRKRRHWYASGNHKLKTWRPCSKKVNEGTRRVKEVFKDARLRVPEAFESSCCAEFGLSRERIRQHPLKMGLKARNRDFESVCLFESVGV